MFRQINHFLTTTSAVNCIQEMSIKHSQFKYSIIWLDDDSSVAKHIKTFAKHLNDVQRHKIVKINVSKHSELMENENHLEAGISSDSALHSNSQTAEESSFESYAESFDNSNRNEDNSFEEYQNKVGNSSSAKYNLVQTPISILSIRETVERSIETKLREHLDKNNEQTTCLAKNIEIL